TWEAGQRRAYRMDQVDQSITQNASTIQQHPELYEQLTQSQLQSINDISGELHADDKRAANEKTRRMFSEAASYGFVNKNPQAAANILLGENPLAPMTVQSKIVAGAKAAGVDPNVALGIASYETGGKFNPDAKNPGSTASGLYQFTRSTWNQYAPPGAN